MSNAPSNFAAVVSNQRSILFYTVDNTIMSLTSGTDDNETFTLSTLKNEKGQDVKTKFDHIDAVAYEDDEGSQIRLYYIGRGPAGYCLKELCQTNGGNWFAGALDKSQVAVSGDSPIASNVQGNRLKVFFEQGDEKLPRMTWAPIGSPRWTSTEIAPNWVS